MSPCTFSVGDGQDNDPGYQLPVGSKTPPDTAKQSQTPASTTAALLQAIPYETIQIDTSGQRNSDDRILTRTSSKNVNKNIDGDGSTPADPHYKNPSSTNDSNTEIKRLSSKYVRVTCNQNATESTKADPELKGMERLNSYYKIYLGVSHKKVGVIVAVASILVLASTIALVISLNSKGFYEGE